MKTPNLKIQNEKHGLFNEKHSEEIIMFKTKVCQVRGQLNDCPESQFKEAERLEAN